MPVSLKKVKIYTDGGSRGNPGPAACGFVITSDSGIQLVAKGLFLGNATNNIAEYTGILNALQHAKEMGANEIQLFSDSELIVKQINGQYRVKNACLKEYYDEIMTLLRGFSSWDVIHVYREKNKEADVLVNKALDSSADVEIKNDSQALKKKQKPIRLAVLISGGGRTLLNIDEQIKKGVLNAEISLVISSRSTAAGVERTKNIGYGVKIIRKKDYPDVDQFSRQIERELIAAKVDLVIQAGWLCLWKIPTQYKYRVMNIHPALLPSFGGQGMWGHHVHEAVLKAGCKISGCTVHFCTNEYDNGPIIVQLGCPVKDDDSADTLAERVFEQECIAYPLAISLFEQKKLTVEGNVVHIH
ncbi:MAG TPA: phosphoribosylglycinamide formyltransferase [Sedimentisphaerales bacterium]|nr:phosphoribosylglycinamide formyltransferase [Sedimentisphaerales bacterium]